MATALRSNMSTCLVAIGSNLGEQNELCRLAVAKLEAHPRIEVAQCSSWHTTSPIGGPSEQEDYLNGAARLRTDLTPFELLEYLNHVETQLGRQRKVRWAARTIDLDLLLFDQVELATPTMVLPHPRMAFRGFVLAPAIEVAADMVHPPTGWTIQQLYDNTRHRPTYVAVAGPIGVGKTDLVRTIGNRFSARQVVAAPPESLLTRFFGDPKGEARDTEVAILQQRSTALDARIFSDHDSLILSDFWFDQSFAYASPWLTMERHNAFGEECLMVGTSILRPALLVMLDAPPEYLLGRIQSRNRAYELALTTPCLDRLRKALHNQARQPDVGPVINVDVTVEDHHEEVAAAIQAILS